MSISIRSRTPSIGEALAVGPILFPQCQSRRSPSITQRWLAHELEESLLYGRKVAIVMNGSSLGLGSADDEGARWIHDQFALIAEVCVGLCFVTPAPFRRHFISAVRWLSPLPCSTRVVKDANHAIRWCVRQLEAAGVPCPPIDELTTRHQELARRATSLTRSTDWEVRDRDPVEYWTHGVRSYPR